MINNTPGASTKKEGDRTMMAQQRFEQILAYVHRRRAASVHELSPATGAPEGKHFRAADVQVGHLWEISIRQPFRWHTVRRAGLLAG